MAKFETGDVVQYLGKDTFWSRGDAIHIIHEVSYIGKGHFEYTTNQGAWFQASDFKLIRKADKASFKQLDKDLKEEGMLY